MSWRVNHLEEQCIDLDFFLILNGVMFILRICLCGYVYCCACQLSQLYMPRYKICMQMCFNDSLDRETQRFRNCNIL